MFVLLSHIPNLPILSLRNGQAVAAAGQPIINPDNLEIVAIFCQDGGWLPWRKSSSVILTRDIREIAGEGIIIDSLEDIEDIGEIVRLKEVIDRSFSPQAMPVISESGQSLGRVEDCTINSKTFRVQKLYVKQSLIKNMLLNNLVIDRSQIIEINTKRILVKDATIPKKKPLMAPQPITPQSP